MLTRSKTIRLVKIVVVSLAILLIVTYAIWRSLNYARGPHITIFEPANGSSVSTRIVVIKGLVERANNLKLNGKDISIDEQGNFVETIIVFPGSNIITIFAEDQFDRSTETQLQILYL